jgi:hypothetical protein
VLATFQEQLDRLVGASPELVGDAGRAGLQLQPDRTVALVVERRFEDHPVQVLDGTDGGPRRVVPFLEVPPLLSASVGRDLYAVPVGELFQRRRTHRAGQVQVQVRLGQRRQITLHYGLTSRDHHNCTTVVPWERSRPHNMWAVVLTLASFVDSAWLRSVRPDFVIRAG